MLEMLKPTSANMVRDQKSEALITDGRFSGGSHGFVITCYAGGFDGMVESCIAKPRYYHY
jgi:hypothetical protein